MCCLLVFLGGGGSYNPKGPSTGPKVATILVLRVPGDSSGVSNRCLLYTVKGVESST